MMGRLAIGDKMELEDSILKVNRGLFQKEQAFVYKIREMGMDMYAAAEYGIKELSLSKERLNYWINVYNHTILQELIYL